MVPNRSLGFLQRKQLASRAALICNILKADLMPLLEDAVLSSMCPKPRYIGALLSARLQTIGSFAWNPELSHRCSDVKRSVSELLPTHSWSPLQ